MNEVEAVARAIAPSRWEVMDHYLAQTKRKYAGENVAYDPDNFKDRESMATAQAAIAALDAARGDQVARVEALSDNGELLTIAWMDGSHSSNTAHRARIAELEAEVERLRRNVKGWVEWHRRCDADDDCTYLNDNAWCDAEALASTGMGLLARTALGASHD